MCGGDGGAGAARAAAAQQAAEYERQLAQVEAQNRATIEAMKTQYTPPPVDTMATVENASQGIRPKTSKKSSTLDANTGKDALKINLNTGSTGSSNVNLG